MEKSIAFTVVECLDRIVLCGNIGRICKCSDEKVRMFIEASAKTDGSIQFLKELPGVSGVE